MAYKVNKKFIYYLADSPADICVLKIVVNKLRIVASTPFRIFVFVSIKGWNRRHQQRRGKTMERPVKIIHYHISQTANGTALKVEIDITDDSQDHFLKAWPLALNKVKELAEKN